MRTLQQAINGPACGHVLMPLRCTLLLPQSRRAISQFGSRTHHRCCIQQAAAAAAATQPTPPHHSGEAPPKKRLAVFVSGGGSNFRAIHAATQQGTIHGEVAVVVSNAPTCGGCEYARQHGIPTLTYPALKDDPSAGLQPEQLVQQLTQVHMAGRAVCRQSPPPNLQHLYRYVCACVLSRLLILLILLIYWIHPSNGPFAQNCCLTPFLQEYGVDVVVLAGYLKLIPSELVRAFKRRILNIHPALLPAFGGQGYYGARVRRRWGSQRAAAQPPLWGERAGGGAAAGHSQGKLLPCVCEHCLASPSPGRCTARLWPAARGSAAQRYTLWTKSTTRVGGLLGCRGWLACCCAWQFGGVAGAVVARGQRNTAYLLSMAVLLAGPSPTGGAVAAHHCGGGEAFAAVATGALPRNPPPGFDPLCRCAAAAAGPILAQAVVPVFPTDSPQQLAARVLKEEHRLYPECVAALCEGRVTWRDDGVPILWSAH
jgi:folate-dependent phosphoribosylglycinamide formyltransferase PurN